MRNSEVSDLSLKIASQFLVLYRFFLNYSGDQEVLFNFDVISKKLSPSSKGSSLDPDYLDKHSNMTKGSNVGAKLSLYSLVLNGLELHTCTGAPLKFPCLRMGVWEEWRKDMGFRSVSFTA